MRSVQTLGGSCHCRAVRFEIETDFPELTTCDCSICRRVTPDHLGINV
jgi:hypothetical protein